MKRREAQRYLDAYVDRLLADAAELSGVFCIENVPTLYIGGGTPSILGAERMEMLLAGLQAIFFTARRPSVPMEITVEANPESLDENFLSACKSCGVTRISLGVQTFYEESRRAVHRTGDLSSEQIEQRMEMLSQYYPGAFSVDLIAGLPLQDKAALLEDIGRLLAFEQAHVSLYSLVLEDDTP